VWVRAGIFQYRKRPAPAPPVARGAHGRIRRPRPRSRRAVACLDRRWDRDQRRREGGAA
jgi:hypothetical protein